MQDLFGPFLPPRQRIPAPPQRPRVQEVDDDGTEIPDETVPPPTTLNEQEPPDQITRREATTGMIDTLVILGIFLFLIILSMSH